MAHVLMSLLMIITVLRFSSSPDTSSNPVLDLGFPACGTVRSKCMFKLPGLGYFCFSKEPVLNPCVSTLYAWMITVNIPLVFRSVQFSRSVVSDALRPHELQHAWPPCPSITNSWSSLKLTSIKSMMPSSHLILCHPLLHLPPIPPSFRPLLDRLKHQCVFLL